MPFRDGPRKDEAEPRPAFCLPVLRAAVEAVEDALAIALGNARAIVFHHQPGPRFQQQVDAPADRHVFEGIVEQVGHETRQLVLFAVDLHAGCDGPFEPVSRFLCAVAIELADTLAQGAQIDRPQPAVIALPRLAGCNIEQVFERADERADVLARGHQGLCRRRFGIGRQRLHQLAVEMHQRRADFVRDLVRSIAIGHHQPLHPVERRRRMRGQRIDLVGLFLCRARQQRAGVHRFERTVDARDAALQPAGSKAGSHAHQHHEQQTACQKGKGHALQERLVVVDLMRNEKAQTGAELRRPGECRRRLAQNDRSAFGDRGIEPGPRADIAREARAVEAQEKIMRARAVYGHQRQAVRDPGPQFPHAAARIDIDKAGEIDVHRIAAGFLQRRADGAVGDEPEPGDKRDRNRDGGHDEARENGSAGGHAHAPSRSR